MTYAYSIPQRESEPNALPDIEVFEYTSAVHVGDETYFPGWYYWHCFPGCLPDGDPIGPFESENDALEDAQADAWQYDDLL